MGNEASHEFPRQNREKPEIHQKLPWIGNENVTKVNRNKSEEKSTQFITNKDKKSKLWKSEHFREFCIV